MDVLIIGGGAVGIASALNLQQAGASVTVIDAPGRPPSASWGNAGHIAVEQVEPLASWDMIFSAPGRLRAWNGGLSLPVTEISHWLPFSLRLLRAAGSLPSGIAAMTRLLAAAMPAWQRHVATLGAPQLLQQNGHLIVWTGSSAAVRGRAHWLGAESGTARFHDASTADHDALSALLGRTIAGAVRCEGSGQITDLTALAALSRTALATNGGHLRMGQAIGICRDGKRPGVTLSDGTQLFADQIVLAAGIGSKPLATLLGYRVPMIAERGYHLEYELRGWPTNLPPLVFEEHALIVTRFAGAVRACSYLEFSSADAPADPRKWDRIARSVKSLGLQLGEPIGRWMGSRPTLPDYLPAIGRADGRIVYAFGHQHLGLTLAPLTGELVTALVADREPAVPLAPFRLERFA